MRAVILAAGDGGRLGAHTTHVPKPLVRLNDRAIIDYTLEALLACGVRDVAVVTGYREAQVIAELAASAPRRVRLTFISNPHFQARASLSLRAAREVVRAEPFLLTMSDHVLSTALVRRLLDGGERPAGQGISSVATDASWHEPDYVEEATKVAVDRDGFVTGIGKQVGGSVLDTGAFLLSGAAWEAVDAVAEDCELSVIFNEIARRRQLRAVDVSGASWYDVDTADDLAAAARMLAGDGQLAAARS